MLYREEMSYLVEIREESAQPINMLPGRASRSNLPTRIRALFDQLYPALAKKGSGLNVVYYPGTGGDGEFDIECGVQVASGGNSATPAGTVATIAYFGPYSDMRPAHEAIHQWARDNGRKLTGASWEVYGHWTDDPTQLRTDIFYLLA